MAVLFKRSDKMASKQRSYVRLGLNSQVDIPYLMFSSSVDILLQLIMFFVDIFIEYWLKFG